MKKVCITFCGHKYWFETNQSIEGQWIYPLTLMFYNIMKKLDPKMQVVESEKD